VCSFMIHWDTQTRKIHLRQSHTLMSYFEHHSAWCHKVKLFLSRAIQCNIDKQNPICIWRLPAHTLEWVGIISLVGIVRWRMPCRKYWTPGHMVVHWPFPPSLPKWLRSLWNNCRVNRDLHITSRCHVGSLCNDKSNMLYGIHSILKKQVTKV
jgi:hypothetical protein